MCLKELGIEPGSSAPDELLEYLQSVWLIIVLHYSLCSSYVKLHLTSSSISSAVVFVSETWVLAALPQRVALLGGHGDLISQFLHCHCYSKW